MTLPQGAYTGTVHGIFRPLNLFWRGKVFTNNTVKNRILGRLLIEGDVTREDECVVIRYRRLGLEDHLTQRDENVWDGSMLLWVFVVRFTLTKEVS